MSLKNAFDFMSNLSSRTLQIVRVVGTPIAQTSIQVSPSNYFRNLQAPEDMRILGTEFVISLSELKRVGYSNITEGDILIDPDLGNLTIVEVRPMILLGSLVGYRVRCG